MLETKYGITYELLFYGDSEWTEITSLINSKQTKITYSGCSTKLKSVVSKCDIEMKYSRTPSKIAHSIIVGKMLAAKENGEIVKFRMSGFDSFVGKVDLGNFSQNNGRIPGFVSITCEDNSYLLEEKMPTSFEYPANNDLDDEGYSVFDKSNLAESIVMLRLIDAGYAIADVDIDNSDSIPEKVRRVVYDSEDEETYREFLDTLLFEHCSVYLPTLDGKIAIKRLYRENPISERNVSDFLFKNGLNTKGGDYQFDGVKVTWSNLGKLLKAVVFNANITTEVDDAGDFVGEEIQPEHYYPTDGDIEETWQEFNATFLDRAYTTKESRLKNKDISLISVKNAYYEVDKDSDVILANNPPEIEPTKARVLFYNKNTDEAKKIYGFTIVGDALFRNKLNESTYPIGAKKLDDPYETKHIFNLSGAEKLANHLHRFNKYGDLQHSWTEHNVPTPLFQVVTVSAPDTLISSLAMVVSQVRTYPAPNVLELSNNAIGITPFNSEPVKTRSVMLGGAPVNTGPAGENGTRSVVQYSLGTSEAPYSENSNIVGTDLSLVGTTIALLGVDNGEWTYEVPIPDVGQFVWKREGFYTPPDVWPRTWNTTRLTGASAFGLTLNASAITVPTSSRGVPRGDNITINALLQNIPLTYEIEWSVTGITFDTVTDNKVRVCLVNTMSGNSAIITASCLFAGVTYTTQITLTKVADGLPAPYNFGGVAIVPTETPLGEPLVAGDFFLWVTTSTEDYTKGQIYEYNGSSWILSTNGDLVMAVLDSFSEIANDVDDTVIGNAVIKKLATLNAIIQNLKAQILEVLDGAYSLKINKTDGILATYDGVKKFQSSPDGITELVEARLLDGSFISDEFSTQKSSGSGAVFTDTVVVADYDTSQASVFFEAIKDKVVNDGAISGDYKTLAITGSYKGTSFTSVRKLILESRAIDATWSAQILGGVLTIEKVGSEPYLWDELIDASETATASYSTWSVNGDPAYIKFSTFADQFITTLPLNTSCNFTGDVTIVKGGGTFSVSTSGKILVTTTSISFYSSTNVLQGVVYSYDGILVGTDYDISVEAAVQGIKTMNVIPVSDDSYDVGVSNKRFKNGYFNNFDSIQINEEDTTNVVYGAVFN